MSDVVHITANELHTLYKRNKVVKMLSASILLLIDRFKNNV